MDGSASRQKDELMNKRWTEKRTGAATVCDASFIPVLMHMYSRAASKG